MFSIVQSTVNECYEIFEQDEAMQITTHVVNAIKKTLNILNESMMRICLFQCFITLNVLKKFKA